MTDRASIEIDLPDLDQCSVFMLAFLAGRADAIRCDERWTQKISHMYSDGEEAAIFLCDFHYRVAGPIRNA